MNTTFTTCAEKKAKQFLNLLQGYTKGIRMTAILILLLMGVNNAWAYNYGGTNVYYYFANTGSWPGVHLYIWNGTWNTDFTLTQITNTKVYYYKWGSAYNGNEGILFRGAANWNNGQTSDIKANYTSHTSWVHNNTTGKTDLSNINRSAQVAVKLSTGGNYTQTANANCVAKVSGYTIVAGNSSATAKNASTSGSSATASISAAYGSTITYTATAGTGYTFKGFSTSNSTSLPSSPSASGKTATASAYGSSNNTTYYAYFKANQYTVKFDANGGSGTMSNQSYAYGVSQALTTNAFTRTGYTFAGWNTKADGTGTSYTDKHSVSNLSSTDGATITLYAQWTANTYTITLGKQGGTGGTEKVTVTYNDDNYSVSPVIVPTKTGYTFGGYYSGTSCTGVQVVDASGKWVKGATGYTDANGNWINTSAGTLYACWTIVEETKYDITISADANGSVNPSGTQKVGASGIQVTATPNDGYEFNQWSYTGGAEAVPSNSATTTVTATANGTIKASFVAKTCTLSLGKMDGTGSTETVTVQYKNNNYSANPVTVPSREGYIFNGYYSGNGCNGKPVVDESGEWVKGATGYTDANGNWINTSNGTTLYACWTEKSHDVTIRYLSGTTSIKEQTIESGVGEVKAKSISAPDITGYVFTGWTLGDGITNKSANTTTNPISITTKAEGTYMLTANYQKAECVYFINTGRWTKVQIYAWLSSNQDKNADWPGVAMEKLNETINGYEVYRYIRPAGKNYDKLIFNNKTGDSGEQTSDLDWEDGKYYVYSVGQWVEREHVEDYLPNPVIYFKNHLGWENVYVYFFTSDNWNYGAITQGLTEANGRVCKMEKVGDTDIYKYDYSGSNFAPGNVIAFTKDLQPNYDKLHNTEAAYRSDYNPSMELYIPQKDVSSTDNGTKYHNKGLWMRYNSQESGYSITGGFNNWNHNDDKFITGTPGSYQFTAEMALSAGETYNFKLKNIKNDWYSTGTSITANKAIEFITEHDGDAQIKTETDGNYVFTVDLSEGKLMLTVKYAVEIGDYRIIYKDNADDNWSGHDKPVKAKWYHPSRIIKKNNTDEATKDFVSFFINKDQSPELILQRCSAITNGSPTWADDQDIEIPREITESTESGGGVYNFVLNQTEKGETKTVEYAGPYTGNYYIRCNAMDGKWNKYKTNSDNRMFYSAFSESDANSFGDKYSHYATKYCTSGTDIKFTIANDYSDCISDTLVTDIKITGNQVTLNPFGNTDNGVLTGGDDYNANIRFMWNRKTNKISRAYVGGSSESNFLVLQGNKDFDDTNNKKSITFSDTQNWIYEINVKVHPDTRAKLYACYPRSKQVSEAQYFRGVYDTKANENWDNNNSAILLGGSGSESYDMRVLYDFKTNRLMAALVPSGNIEGEVTIDADVMIMREHQKDATCITLANDKSSLNNVKTVYGAMKFNRTTINNRDNNGNELNDSDKKSIYERALYFISFPFDVHLSDVFGFGTYGTHWVISDYNGLRRAQKGYFIETCYTEDCTNWDYIWRPDTFTMKANTGYLLSLDLDLMQYDNMDFWKHGITYVELFFPSEVQLQTIQQTNYTMPALGEKYKCTINFNKVGPGEDGYNPDNDHRVRDSYWRCIGVPSFANYNGQLYNEDIDPGHKYPIEWQPESNEFPFLYQWNTDDNSLQVQNTSNFNFRATFAYLVQNGNSIYWSAVNAKPSNIVARKQEAKRNYDWKITIARNGEVEDQTFVRLTDHEKVTTEFDFNQDLSKEFNYGRCDIYTLIGYEKAAANSLPLSEQTTLIPLGLSIEYNGDYTIAMPDGTANIGVTLVDNQTGTRTNLSAGMEHTLTLNKGDYNNRFFIEISPIQQTPTDIEYVENSHDDQARKVLIDNILYIVRDGQIFDARGARVK